MSNGKNNSAWNYLVIITVVCGLFLAGWQLRPIMAQTVSPVNQGIVVTDGSRLNVRDAPAIDAEIVGKLAPGAAVAVVEVSDDGNWYRIESQDAEEAWIAADFIELGPDDEDNTSSSSGADDTATIEQSTSVDEEATSVADEADALDDPSSSADAEASFVLLPTLTPTPNTTPDIGDEQVEGSAPTVSSDVLTATAPADTAVVPTATPTSEEFVSPAPLTTSNEQGTANTVGSQTNMTTTSESLATTEVTTTLDTNGTSTRATVVRDGITPTATLTEAVSVGQASSRVVTETRVANDADAVAVVVPENITTPTPARIGLASDENSSITPEPTSSPTPPPVPTRAPTPSVPAAITQPQRMNVRSGPSTNYSIVTSVPAGTELEILALSPDGTWYQVEAPNQEEPAWVYAPLTDAVGPTDSLQRLSQDDIPPEPTPEPAILAASASPPIVSAPPPAGGGFFGYGVQAHMLGGGVGQALNSTSEMGFSWIKQQVEWKLFQPQPGGIGMGALGGIVSEAGNRGISVLFSVVNAPDWAREPGFDASVGGPPADPQTYANFVGAMAGEFCGTALKAIEIWNEQNLHYEWGNLPLDPAQYVALLRPSYASIKAACPSMLVISGALTPAGSNPPFAVDDFAYLEGMYQNGLANYADGVGAHPSGYNVPPSVRFEEACGVIQQTGNSFNGACDTPHHSWSFRSTMEGYRNIMVVYGDANKRIWPTEFGWAAGGAFDPRYAYANDNSFDEQAAWTVEAFQMMKSWGWVGPAFLWNLNFRVVADGTEKAQWGIVRNDYSPLPVYDALRTMAK